jgi:hypothetical protein
MFLRCRNGDESLQEEKMAKNFVSWVHGYAAVPEWMGSDVLQLAQDPTRPDPRNPDFGEPDFVTTFSDVNGWRRAWGACFSLAPDRDNWFHIAIPTPVIVEDRRAGLDRVMALFRIDAGQLRRVLVFDGPNVIRDLGGLAVGGDHTHDLVDNSNVFHVDHDNINFGVGFSLNFLAFERSEQLSNEPTQSRGANLYIASAGGIFWHNI